MKSLGTDVGGASVIELDPHGDERGLFVEAFVAVHLERLGISFAPSRMHLSFSRKAGTIRGMHWQDKPFDQGKIVMAVGGSFHDVAVDVTTSSPSYGKHYAVHLEPFKNAFYVPRGLAHGCQSLEDNSTLLYLVDNEYSSPHERGIRFNDPVLDIHWPLPALSVSPRDLAWPSFKKKSHGPAQS